MIAFVVFVASFFILCIIIRLTKASYLPVLSGFCIRTLLAVSVYLEILEPPGTQSDSINFLNSASQWSNLEWGNIAQLLIPDHSYVHAAVGASVYKIIGEQPLVLILSNVFLGTLLVILTYQLSRKLIGERRAKVVVWIAALFPPAIIYSAAFLREAWGGVPFMLGLLSVARWQQEEDKTALFFAVIYFILASFFHGGYVASILVLFLWSGKDVLKPFYALKPKISNRMFLTSLMGVVVLGAILISAIGANVNLGSIGDLSERITNPGEAAESRLTRETEGGSAFPAVAGGESLTSRPWLLPIRFAYFLFSPFPWDIRSLGHIQGFVATGVFLYIAISIYRSRKQFRGRKDVMAVGAILGAMILLFTIGTDNIGTSIRHRTKFLFGLLALCGSPIFKPMAWGKKPKQSYRLTPLPRK